MRIWLPDRPETASAPSQLAGLASRSEDAERQVPEDADGGRGETEAGDEEGAYEVEVTPPDGSQVDIHLDKGFNVISQADDSDRGGDDDGGE